MSRAHIMTARYDKDGRKKAIAMVLHHVSDSAMADPTFIEAKEASLRDEVRKDLGYLPPFDTITYHHWAVL